MKVYGNVINRIMEGHNYNDDKQIHPGDDITMYLWSDRECYYVTDVINQKRINVKRYHVVADHSKNIGMGHQDWLYFKSQKEVDEYLSKYFDDVKVEDEYEDEEPETWVYRYNKWMGEVTFTKENYCTEREKKSLKEKGFYKRYYELSGRVSFGSRDYYYDWSF